MKVVLFRVHFFPGLCLLALGLGLQFLLLRRLLERFGRRAWLMAATAVSTTVLLLGYLLEFHRFARYFPVGLATWTECAALVETMLLIGVFFAALVWRAPILRRHTQDLAASRRAFLKTASVSLAIAPLAATGFGIIQRNRFRLSEVSVPVPNLGKDLDGLRIVQITDIHLSPFLSEQEFARTIDMANETRAHIGLVTGDLISRRGDPLDACLKQLARLRAEAGILGCLGNHEVYTGTEEYVTESGRKIGIDFLRHRARVLKFGKTALNFAGVDYQRFEHRYLVGTEQLVMPGAINVLLSHNPDVFPVAASQGFDLTIAGHTHGGQVNFEILHENWNVARYYTRYVRGLYREGRSAVYVSSGIGTIGVPVRIGAPPEVSLIRLCAT